MTLSRRIARVRGSYWPVVVGSMAVAALVGLGAGLGGVGLMAAFGIGAAETLAWPRVVRRLGRRIGLQHQRQLEEALAEGDDETRRRLAGELDEYYRALGPRAERQRLLARGHAHASDESWGEALAVVGKIDREALTPAERASHDNFVAWCCAHAGETARAVELARAAVASADGATKPYFFGTLGTVLVLDGQYAEGQTMLNIAIALGGPRWAQAVRRYYLGEALAKLGRHDEACAEWQQAVTIAPRSRWGRRAQERLSAGPPPAYR